MKVLVGRMLVGIQTSRHVKPRMVAWQKITFLDEIPLALLKPSQPTMALARADARFDVDTSDENRNFD
jgi:hypothetical protein